jgi:N-formylglutamate amidohydrolase
MLLLGQSCSAWPLGFEHFCAYASDMFGLGRMLYQDKDMQAGRFSSPPQPVRLVSPRAAKGGLVVACPHSGRYYPDALLASSRLDPLGLRRSEDAFVDELFSAAPAAGAFLMTTDYARAFVDLNRDADELDAVLVVDLPPEKAGNVSPRVDAGLGVIPRTVGDGIEIYTHPLSFEDVQARLADIYVPWHSALDRILTDVCDETGHVVLLDCHSMPCAASGVPSRDIVLGDRYGAACAPILMDEAFSFLSGRGFKVARNNPYAGGYAIQRYGRPDKSRHALQIEINRSLYMVEGALTKKSAFGDLQALFEEFVAHLAIASQALSPSKTG